MDQPQAARTSTVVGTLENNEIDEASGLARSQVDPDVLWLVNDDGPAVLHAIDSSGNMLARVKIADTSNRDWEDLASFTLDGVPYLLLADIGDNAAKRKTPPAGRSQRFPTPRLPEVSVSWWGRPDGASL